MAQSPQVKILTFTYWEYFRLCNWKFMYSDFVHSAELTGSCVCSFWSARIILEIAKWEKGIASGTVTAAGSEEGSGNVAWLQGPRNSLFPSELPKSHAPGQLLELGFSPGVISQLCHLLDMGTLALILNLAKLHFLPWLRQENTTIHFIWLFAFYLVHGGYSKVVAVVLFFNYSYWFI